MMPRRGAGIAPRPERVPDAAAATAAAAAGCGGAAAAGEEGAFCWQALPTACTVAVGEPGENMQWEPFDQAPSLLEACLAPHGKYRSHTSSRGGLYFKTRWKPLLTSLEGNVLRPQWEEAARRSSQQ